MCFTFWRHVVRVYIAPVVRNRYMLVFVTLCANLWPKFIRMKINWFIMEADSVLLIYLAYVA